MKCKKVKQLKFTLVVLAGIIAIATSHIIYAQEEKKETQQEEIIDVPKDTVSETPKEVVDETIFKESEEKSVENRSLTTENRSTATPRSAGDIQIDEMNFPDPVFRNYIKTTLFNDPSKTFLTRIELESILTIDINNRTDIKSLKGIEHFTKITTLKCVNTGLLSLDLSKNTSITTFDRISTIPTKVVIKQVTPNLLDLDKNIDSTNILNIKGAIKSGTVLSNFVLGSPIEYDYKCDNNYTMKVMIALYGENSWATDLAISNWTYKDTANAPITRAVWGNATYSFSNSATGTYTNTVPTTAGTWYVKANVEEKIGEYTGLQSGPVVFSIIPKNLVHPTITSSTVASEADIAKLIVTDGGEMLVNGRDYVVSASKKDTLVTVDITGIGNYQGTIEKTYTDPSPVPPTPTPVPPDVEGENIVVPPKSETSVTTMQKAPTSLLVTGDQSNIVLPIILLVISGGLVGFLWYKRKK